MEQLHDLQCGPIYRVSTPSAFDLTIELALSTGVRLLVCGNRLPFYDMAYELARRVGQQYDAILKERMTFSRAETCTQLLDFLGEMQADTVPLFITDILTHFDEEDPGQVDELFFACQIELERLSKETLVFINATPRPPLERLGYVLERITHKLDGNG